MNLSGQLEFNLLPAGILHVLAAKEPNEVYSHLPDEVLFLVSCGFRCFFGWPSEIPTGFLSWFFNLRAFFIFSEILLFLVCRCVFYIYI